jgi:hypothetical protein
MNFWSCKTKSYLAILLILGSVFKPAIAQHESNKRSSAISAIGIQIGYGDTYVDDCIRGHAVFGAFAEVPLSKTMAVRVEGEYSQSKSSSPWVDFEYKGTVYTALQSQVWRNWSLGAGILTRVSPVGRLGAGAGLELIDVHRVSYNSDWIFWVNFYEDNVNLVESNVLDESETFLRPSAYVMADFERNLISSFSLVAGLRYKLIFVGEKYGHTALDTENTYSISVGIKYRLQ